MKARLNLYIVCLCALWLMTGCITGSLPSPNGINVTATEFVTPTKKPFFTPTNIPTTAVPAIVVLSPTSLPLIATDTAKEVLSQFIRENGGCKLPCLMGLSPINSNRTAVEAFSRYFQANSQRMNDELDSLEIFSHYNDNSGGAILVFWKTE
jgi:hypothetical protein